MRALRVQKVGLPDYCCERRLLTPGNGAALSENEPFNGLGTWDSFVEGYRKTCLSDFLEHLWSHRAGVRLWH